MKLFRIRRRLRIFWHRRFGVGPLRESMPDLADWLRTPLGRALLNEEQTLLDGQLQDLFGYYLVQLSIDPTLNLVGCSRIGRRVGVSPRVDLRPSLSPLITEHQHLPLPTESVDVVVLHHLLDYSQTPHQVLREVSRVLIPHGHVVIVGFNPWSGFGLWRWIARGLSRRPRWRHQSLRLGRLLDWMELVNLQPVSVERGFYRPPVNHPGILGGLRWFDRCAKRLRCPGGAIYVVVACKEVGGAIPVKPAWERTRASIPGLGANPLRREERKNIH